MDVESVHVLKDPASQQVHLSMVMVFTDVAAALRYAASLTGTAPVQMPSGQQKVSVPEPEPEPEPARVDWTAPDYDSMDRAQLKKMCVERGLTTNSNKSGAAAFKAMLLESDAKGESAPATKPVVVETVTPPLATEPLMAPATTATVETTMETPAALANSTSFRQVMTWMMEQGFTEQGAILDACNAHKANVPALKRLSGDLGDRIGRALEVLKMEMA